MKQSDVDRIWYDGEPVPLWLRALVPFYRALTAGIRWTWTSGLRKPVHLPVPVVVVGNLTAGGTGKTPLVLALIEALRERGWNPGVVSRGYGGSARSPVMLDHDPDSAAVGDEPGLIKRRSGVPVAVGAKRVDAARLLFDSGVDVILADDGLQNPSLARDIEICVIDGQRRFGNGRLLPAGPLRENASRLGRVDFIVCNGGSPHDGEIPMNLRGSVARSIVGDQLARPLSDFAGSKVHAVAGIGNPQRFFASLREQGMEVIEHSFSDHYPLAESDISFSDELPVLMTEKDAVKCRRFAKDNHWQVPVDAQLPESFFDTLDSDLRNVRSPSRSS